MSRLSIFEFSSFFGELTDIVVGLDFSRFVSAASGLFGLTSVYCDINVIDFASCLS